MKLKSPSNRPDPLKVTFALLPVTGLVTCIAIGWLTGSASQAAPRARTPQTSTSRRSTPTVTTEANDPQLRALRTRLRRAKDDVEQLERLAAQFPIFDLSGTYESGDAREISVYGKAIGYQNSPFGWLRERTFFRVLEPYPTDLNNGYFRGNYMFARSDLGINIYVRPPVEYAQAVTALNTRRDQRAMLEDLVEDRLTAIRSVAAARERERAAVEQARQARLNAAAAQRLDAVERQRRAQVAAQVEAFFAAHTPAVAVSTDPEFFHQYAQDSLALYNQLQPQDDFPRLRENYIVQLTHAAELQARAGGLSQAEEAATQAFWFDAPSLKSVYQQHSFGEAAAATYTQHPEVLQRLLGAWATALPGYLERAEYAGALKARKFSEVLLRCAADYQFPEKETLLAAVNTAAALGTTNRMTGANTAPDTTGATAATEPSTPRIVMPPTSRILPPNLNPPMSAQAPLNAPPPAQTPDTAAPPPQTTEGPRTPALNFYFAALKDGHRYQLRDFVGKVVVLLLWSFNDEDRDASPTPVERLCALSRGYDPNKVVFLLVNDKQFQDVLQQEVERRTDTAQSEQWNLPRRAYTPGTFFYLDAQLKDLADNPSWQDIFQFYCDRSYSNMSRRLTVIDTRGDRVGQLDFIYNQAVSEQNEATNRNSQTDVYDLDKDALDALIIRALTP